MAELRGSKDVHTSVAAESLALLLDFDDIEEIKKGIQGVIRFLERDNKEVEKKNKKISIKIRTDNNCR